jgi:hypothetical protein
VGEFPLGDRSALEFQAWLIDPAGQRFLVRGVNVVRVEDGRFLSVRSYEDPPALVRLAPVPSERGNADGGFGG